MADFNIDVGFSTKALSSQFGKQTGSAGVGNGADSGTSQQESTKNGFIGALKGAGVIALLMKITPLVEIMTGILAILKLGVILFMKKIYEFFQDPARGLLNFGIFIVNGFIGAIEKLANWLKPGKDMDFGRFRSDVVGEELDAGASLLQALKKGFMKEEEYADYVWEARAWVLKAEQDNTIAKLKALDERTTAEQAYEEEIKVTLVPAMNSATGSFLTFWKNMETEISKMNKAVTGRSFKVDYSKFTPSAESIKFGTTTNQTSVLSPAEARVANLIYGVGT